MCCRCIRNESNKGGGNLLNYAARGGSGKLAKLLIEKGVSIDPEDYEVSGMMFVIALNYETSVCGN